MQPQEQKAGTARLGTAAEWLGYLSVAPLVACLAGIGLLSGLAERELAQRIALGWGAVLLALTGGVHLGLALGGRLPGDPVRIAAAVVPSVLGAIAVVMGGQRGLALLVVGFGTFWLYEHRSLGTHLPPAYLNLRRHLTLAICILLAFAMFVSDGAGLS
ncbi:MAG TPA: DUF3429 domain-containing protein [Steroidobacteraceae bacterium]|nr:DUF3429 domain-containing protein [Steroidobacteraceae bacterium]